MHRLCIKARPLNTQLPRVPHALNLRIHLWGNYRYLCLGSYQPTQFAQSRLAAAYDQALGALKPMKKGQIKHLSRLLV
jgi:hypothetical protein